MRKPTQIPKRINALVQALEQRNAELVLFSSIQEALLSRRDMSFIFELVGDQLHTMFEGYVISIATFDHESGTEYFQYHLEDGKRIYPDPRPYNKIRQILIDTHTQIMVNEMMNQLRELHQTHIDFPYVTWFRNWAEDPFGGGYHAWKAGYKVGEVMKYMRRPLQSENIHICGEAYSQQQGWVEGAFCEAEKMLEEHFGLDRPEWLDPTYYLGW